MSKTGKQKDAEDAISAQLKQYYGSVEEEPIPEHLLNLLEKLDDAEEASRKADNAPEKGDKS